MFRARVPHPEFGYADTSNYSFFSTFMAFVVCGVVAGAISIAIFNSEPDHDPMDAMALAPAEALIAPKPAQLATQVGRVRPHNQYSYTSSYGARRYNVSRTYSQGGYARLSGFW